MQFKASGVNAYSNGEKNFKGENMLKNKFILGVMCFFLTLSGCSTADNHKVDQNKNESSTIGNKQNNQQTSKSNSASSTPNGEQPYSSKTSMSDDSTSSTPVPAKDQTGAKVDNPDMRYVTAVRLADFKTGWVGGNGWIAKTTSQGKNWVVVYRGNGLVKQIFALNHLDVWATLSQDEKTSKLLHSSDGGRHWGFIGTMPNHSFFHFITKTTVLSGNYVSHDGGKTWSSLPMPKNTIGDSYFHDEKNGWVITQNNNDFQVNRTIDGGLAWKTVMTKNQVSPLNGANIRSAGVNDAWIELIGDSGMTQTSYSLFHTSDGGQTWKTVIANSTAGGGPAPGFSSENNNGPNNKGSNPGPLYVVSPQTAFMGGVCPACDQQNSIGWTKDAGKTWVNSNITLAGSGDSFIALSDPNHGWWITTEYEKRSSLYITSDGGYHWKQVYEFH
jgi:photosystem II stability/assembly factor-like uncharacterized protein